MADWLEPLPRVTHVEVRIEMADGTVHTYTLDGPLDGAVGTSTRRELPDIAAGPDLNLEQPRVFPVQLGFAFALPLSGAIPGTYRVERPGG